MTRLIDADALLARVDEERKYLKARGMIAAEHILVHNFRDLIENAPTVPLPDFKEGYKQAIIDGKTNFSRPQGEWIEENSETGALGIKYTWFKCNQCGWDSSLVIPKNFCPNCGADMRGKEE